MSDYLHNLAAIVAQPGGQVQPRLPGRFEASHRFAGLLNLTIPEAPPEAGDETDSEMPPTISPSSPSTLEPPTNPTRNEPRATFHAGTAQEARDAKLRTARKEMPPPAAASGEESLPHMRSAPVEDASAAAPLERSRRHRSEPRLPNPAAQFPPRPRPSSELAPAGSKEERSTVQHQPSGPNRPAAPRPPSRSAAEEPETPVLALEPHRPQVEPAARPSREGRNSPKAPHPPGDPIMGRVAKLTSVKPAAGSKPLPARPQPVPTIRVTIGRIEIKATPAPPPAPRPVRRTPALPLDQYLRRRDGGEP